jgi:hypothetical protein
MKNIPIHVCAKTSVVDWPSKGSKRICYFHTSCTSIINLENTLISSYKNTVVVTLTTSRHFSHSLAFSLGYGEFYEGGPHVRRSPMKLSATAEILRKSGLGNITFSLIGFFNVP